MSYIGANDLVYTNKDGIYSGGFNVQSIMMKGGISPIMTINNNDEQKGGSTGKVSDIFSGLVVPAYSYYHNGGSKSKVSSYKSHNSDDEDEEEEEDEVIDDDLHDKLLGLVREHDNKLKQEERKKKRTRKHKGKLGKVSTRRNLKKEEIIIEK